MGCLSNVVLESVAGATEQHGPDVILFIGRGCVNAENAPLKKAYRFSPPGYRLALKTT